MRLMLSNLRLPDITDDEQQLRNVLRPLVYNRDGHFLATLSALLFFFGCQLLGYVSRAVRPSVSYNNAKRAIPISWKVTKTFTMLSSYRCKKARLTALSVECLVPGRPERLRLLSQSWSLSTLKIILTTENVAPQAFAEHIIGLSLPSWIEAKIGRLVGYMALQNNTTGGTRLAVQPIVMMCYVPNKLPLHAAAASVMHVQVGTAQ